MRLLLLLSFSWTILASENKTIFRKQAGIYFRLNQKAVNYITDLASDAMPQILEKMILPEIDAGMAKINHIIIQKFEKPKMSAKFVKEKGVSSHVVFPQIRISAKAEINMFFSTLEESIILEFEDLTLEMDAHFSRNETIQRNVIQIPLCKVSAVALRTIYDRDSMLNSMDATIRIKAMDGLKEAICDTTLKALEYVNEQEFSTREVKVTVAPPTPIGFDSSEPSIASEIGTSLCAADRIDDETQPLMSEESTSTKFTADHSTENSPFAKGEWNMDLTLNYPPKFSDEDVVFGVDGGILLNGKHGKDIDMPRTLETKLLQEKMVGIMVSEYTPNTLFAHVFDEGLGSYSEKFYADNLPKVFKSMAKMFCSKCYIEVNAELNDKPRVEIDQQLGARLAISGNVTVLFQSRKKLYNLIDADAKLHVTLKPFIRHSKLYGDVSLTNVDVNVKEIGVGGVLAGPLEKITGFIIPRALWPQVKKRLRFALNKRGFKLPVFCGVELQHLSLDYIDHAAVVNTDFTFDLPRFIRKFKQYLIFKARSANVPTYL